ncbi:4'-phosphopantetheinyl transferase family protein [Vreelandella nigrificans]|uniref:4-phosphopantetheinyl transferase n=1 Tax=Vreelandella nigrificans TaxID=2042704 RepID=A0A2A4HIP9_9GAMM|nr:4'-phosphopantetheinyl transferase superfamily protein [Halomonas nigrificans]PCF93914.1 4-phosphopantetheinyl transferase [Halomonas nigrificans]
MGNRPLLLTPSPSCVDIWLTWLDDVKYANVLNHYVSILSAQEKEQYQRFCFEEDRIRYLVARALIRTTLSRYAHVSPIDWLFTTNSHGRPAIAPTLPLADSVSFNLSHTRKLIALAVTAGHEVGIDVENIVERHAAFDIVSQCFSASEAKEIQAACPEAQSRLFFEYWTLKEAYAKARGFGLSIPLDQCSFDLSQSSSIELLVTQQLNDDSARWFLCQYYPDATHVLALCVSINEPKQQVTIRRLVPLLSERALDLHPGRVSI